MLDRIEKFKNSAPTIPENIIAAKMVELEEFLTSSAYEQTLSKIKPQIASVYDVLLS